MLHLGVSIWPQYTEWNTLRELALLAEDLGYDSIWAWDHFAPIVGDPTGPNLECWQILAAWAALTKRARIGALVCGNTYRHPAVLAKMAVALDHVSGGRAVCGVGAAWFQLEHDAYGIPFDTAGVRLAKLEEAARVIRSLFDEKRTTFEGKYYQLRDAMCEPKPVQARLPIMIGGGGEKKTLRTVARWADMWNGFGDPATIRHKLEVLRGHCTEVGRDFDAIMPTVLVRLVLRDDPREVDGVLEEIRKVNGLQEMQPEGLILGSVEDVAKRLAEYWEAGIRGIILSSVPPHDRQTLERVAREVRPRVEEMIGAGV